MREHSVQDLGKCVHTRKQENSLRIINRRIWRSRVYKDNAETEANGGEAVPMKKKHMSEKINKEKVMSKQDSKRRGADIIV